MLWPKLRLRTWRCYIDTFAWSHFHLKRQFVIFSRPKRGHELSGCLAICVKTTSCMCRRCIIKMPAAMGCRPHGWWPASVALTQSGRSCASPRFSRRPAPSAVLLAPVRPHSCPGILLALSKMRNPSCRDPYTGEDNIDALCTATCQLLCSTSGRGTGRRTEPSTHFMQARRSLPKIAARKDTRCCAS